jgi:hypothetical protein
MQAIENGRRRLAILARETGHSVIDLLDWYKDDLDAIGTGTEAEIRAIVGDYIKRKNIYRDNGGKKDACC